MTVEEESWELEARAFAELTTEALDTLERDIQGLASGGSYRQLWDRTRTLGDAIRTAPAISSTDKIELQRRLNALVRGLREQQRTFHAETEATRAEINGRLELARETATDAESPSDIQEVRADLALLRDRITALNGPFPRSIRSQLWASWQEINRLTWDKLVALRTANAAVLAGMLDEAEDQVKRSQTRAARESIKAFHDRMAQLDVSHGDARTLRQRANKLWETAAERGREQREHYLAAARGRLARSQRAARDIERRRAQLAGQIQMLEQQVSNVSTGMGHALARGQLTEAQREFAKLETESARLQREISELQATVDRDTTPST